LIDNKNIRIQARVGALMTRTKISDIIYYHLSFSCHLARAPKQLETSFPKCMYATCRARELLWKALEPVEHVIVMTEMTLTDRETAVRVLHT